jgi:hypothetical protein
LVVFQVKSREARLYNRFSFAILASEGTAGSRSILSSHWEHNREARALGGAEVKAPVQSISEKFSYLEVNVDGFGLENLLKVGLLHHLDNFHVVFLHVLLL